MLTTTRKIRINGALYRLNTGVQVWNRRGRARLVARIQQADGKTSTQSFEMSPEGVRAANAAVSQAYSETQAYGTAFGSLSPVERRAVELYRAYVSECIGTGHFSRYNRLTNFAVAVHQAGLRMPKNALRHTAASNLCVVLGRSRAADILGHSEKMLVRHYRRAMLPEDAEKMLGITPSQLGL